jgi:hypothetical protein
MRQDGTRLNLARPVTGRLSFVVVLVSLVGATSTRANDEIVFLEGTIELQDGVETAQAQASPTPAVRPPAQSPPAPLPRTFPRSSVAETRQRTAPIRMARSPEMFGDQFVSSPLYTNGFLATGSDFLEFATLGAPGSVNAFSQKISENNHPLPHDRVFYTFNVFDDALKFDSSFDAGLGAPMIRSQSLMRHTVGVEKTFNAGDSSIEVRLPFFDGTRFTRTAGSDRFEYDGGTVGNLLITGKTVIYEAETFVTATGLGLQAPTGDDVVLRVNSTVSRINNSAVYLSPFVGSLWTPNDEWFLMTFSQVQISASGDPVVVSDPLLTRERVGTIQAPHAMSFDLSIGRWLFRDRTESFIEGLALVGEVHQFTTLQDTDAIPNDPGLIGARAPSERLSLTTLTFGVHSLLAKNSTLRVAGVVPMDDDQFDAEMIVQLNFFY